MSKGKVWALVMLGLIIVLPLISLYVMMQGADLRKNAQAGKYFHPSDISLPHYSFISQRGDTISYERMQGKICVIEFYNNNCYEERYPQTHPLFQLQEGYYQKTISLRILSVSLSDSISNDINLQHYSHRYAAREIWHVLGGNIQMADAIQKQCEQYLLLNHITTEPKTDCSSYVFVTDRSQKIIGAYDLKNPEQYDALYKDLLYIIDETYEKK